MNTLGIIQLDTGTAIAIEHDIEAKWRGVELYSSYDSGGMSFLCYENEDEKMLDKFIDEVHDIIIECGGCAHKTAII